MDSMKLPPVLFPGDEIRIIAPASIPEKEYIHNTVRTLENAGYKVSLGKNIFSEYGQFAGTDEQRADDFNEALEDIHVKAVFCARGGYGSIRIVEKIKFSELKTKPKWIVGFSDITIFHTIVNQQYQLASVHAPMPVNFQSPFFSENLKQLRQIIEGKKPVIKTDTSSFNRTGTGMGEVTGGNLSILYSLQATPYEIQTDNKILFIEDVGEQLYHLDRMLCNMQLSGKLKNLAGLIIGGITEMKDKKRPYGKSEYEIIGGSVEKYSFPVAFHFPAGHMDNNIPFIMGAQARLEVKSGKTELIFL